MTFVNTLLAVSLAGLSTGTLAHEGSDPAHVGFTD